MKGYVYKDYRVSLVPIVCMILLAGFVVWAIVVSAADANVNPQELQALVLWSLGTINLITPVVSMFACYDADEKEKFIQYAAAMPGGLKRYIMSKYAFIYSIIAIGTVFSYCVAICSDIGSGEIAVLKNLHWALFAVIGLGLILCSIHFPLAYRFGGRVGNIAASVMIIGTLLGFYIYMMFGDTSKLNDNLWKRILIWMLKNKTNIKCLVTGILVLGVGSTIVSCRISEKACLKGVANHN